MSAATPMRSRSQQPHHADFLDQTIGIWQSRSARMLNREDAREIMANMVGFFRVLAEWDKAERERAGANAAPSDSA